MEEFDFISPTDKPALIAVSTEPALTYARTALTDMGYKIHEAQTHDQLLQRFNQVSYQVVIMEDAFADSPPGDNPSLQMLQQLPMSQRRYCTFIQLGGFYETMNTLQAFGLSVHCVVNYTELAMLPQIIQKVTTDSNHFTNTFRETQQRIFSQAK